MIDNIILASTSPRRSDILKDYDVNFEVYAIEVDETPNTDLAFEDIVVDIAVRKARPVYEKFPDRTILSCDTLVFTENEILTKPKDRDAAFGMIKKLSGITHQVISGCCIIHEERIITFFEITDVTFKTLDDNEINNYLDTEEYIGKSGSYAIQGKASQFVTKIDGSIENVIGLPIDTLLTILVDLDE